MSNQTETPTTPEVRLLKIGPYNAAMVVNSLLAMLKQCQDIFGKVAISTPEELANPDLAQEIIDQAQSAKEGIATDIKNLLKESQELVPKEMDWPEEDKPDTFPGLPSRTFH